MLTNIEVKISRVSLDNIWVVIVFRLETFQIHYLENEIIRSKNV